MDRPNAISSGSEDRSAMHHMDEDEVTVEHDIRGESEHDSENEEDPVRVCPHESNDVLTGYETNSRRSDSNSIASSTLQYVIDSLFHNMTHDIGNDNQNQNDRMSNVGISSHGSIDNHLKNMRNRLKEMQYQHHDVHSSVPQKGNETLDFLPPQGFFVDGRSAESGTTRGRQSSNDNSDLEEVQETDNRVYIRMKRTEDEQKHGWQDHGHDRDDELSKRKRRKRRKQRRNAIKDRYYEILSDGNEEEEEEEEGEVREEDEDVATDGRVDMLHDELNRTRDEIEQLKEQLLMAERDKRHRNRKERRLRDIEKHLIKLIEDQGEEIKKLKIAETDRPQMNDKGGNIHRTESSLSGCHHSSKHQCIPSEIYFALQSHAEQNRIERVSRTAEVQTLHEERKKDRSRIQELESEMQNMRPTYSQRIAELEQELETANTSHSENLLKLETKWKHSQDGQRVRIEGLERKIDTKEKEISLLKEQYLLNIKNAEDENEQLRHELQEASSTIAQLRKESEIRLTTAEQVFDRKVEEVLENENNAKEMLQKKTKKVEDLERKMLNIQEASDKGIMEVDAKLQTEKEKSQQLMEDLSRAKRRIESELRQRLHISQRQKQLEQEYNAMLFISTQNESKNEELQSQVSELESNIAVYKEMYDSVTRRDTKASQFSVVRKRQAELERKATQLHAFMTKVFTRIQRQELEMSATRHEIDRISQSRQEFENHATDVKRRLRELRENSNDTNLVKVIEVVQQKESQIGRDAQRLEQYETTTRKYEDDINDQKDQMFGLIQDMNSYTSELDEIRQAFSLFKKSFLTPEKEDVSHIDDGDDEYEIPRGDEGDQGEHCEEEVYPDTFRSNFESSSYDKNLNVYDEPRRECRRGNECYIGNENKKGEEEDTNWKPVQSKSLKVFPKKDQVIPKEPIPVQLTSGSNLSSVYQGKLAEEMRRLQKQRNDLRQRLAK